MLNKSFLFRFLICLLPLIWQWTISPKHNIESVLESKLVEGGITNCRCADSLVLAKIFKSTNGTVWKEPWDLKTPMENWKGVTLNDEHCVASLRLNNNGLLGFLPPELGTLSDLKKLSLSDNQLQGSIPSVIAQLKNLESLVLQHNEFSGPIPMVLGTLPKLKTLNLSNNELWGTIPVALGDLSMLSGLFLSRNKLEGEIPIALTKLKQLVHLNLSANNLTGMIPASIGDMIELTEISLNENQLTGNLPVSIGNLAQLVSLRLEKNRLQDSLPSNWGNLTNLETIFLHDNDLVGCFPESFEIFCDLNKDLSEIAGGYNFFRNEGLSWGGDFKEFCSGAIQMEADCDENNPVLTTFNRNCLCPEKEESQTVEVTIKEKATCKNANNGTIAGVISFMEAEFKVSWLGTVKNEDIFTNQSFEIKNLGVGEYALTIFLAANDSLIYTKKITISELDCFEIGDLPQLITPNGDGLNDAFIIDALLDNPTFFKDNQLTIFNRWGDEIFHAQPYNNDWSGDYQNGQSVPEGTYYYLLKIDLNEGLIYKGDITIVRK